MKKIFVASTLLASFMLVGCNNDIKKNEFNDYGNVLKLSEYQTNYTELSTLINDFETNLLDYSYNHKKEELTKMPSLDSSNEVTYSQTIEYDKDNSNYHNVESNKETNKYKNYESTESESSDFYKGYTLFSSIYYNNLTNKKDSSLYLSNYTASYIFDKALDVIEYLDYTVEEGKEEETVLNETIQIYRNGNTITLVDKTNYYEIVKQVIINESEIILKTQENSETVTYGEIIEKHLIETYSIKKADLTITINTENYK